MSVTGTKPINLDPDSTSFADVPEADRRALSEAFKAADLWTPTSCRQDHGDGLVFQDEFIVAIGSNPREFAARGFSSSTSEWFPKFRDGFDYLPDFKTGKFVKVTSESTLANQGAEDIWSAFDKTWKQYLEPLYNDVENFYDGATALTDKIAEINASYRENGGAERYHHTYPRFVGTHGRQLRQSGRNDG